MLVLNPEERAKIDCKVDQMTPGNDLTQWECMSQHKGHTCQQIFSKQFSKGAGTNETKKHLSEVRCTNFESRPLNMNSRGVGFRLWHL